MFLCGGSLPPTLVQSSEKTTWQQHLFSRRKESVKLKSSIFVFLVCVCFSLSLSPFSGELGSRIVKRFIFIFRPWNLGQGRKIKILLFSLTLSLRLEKRCCCQVVFILSLHDAFDYKQDLIFVETHCLRFSLPPLLKF